MNKNDTNKKQYLPNYLILVNKKNPIGQNYIKDVELVIVDDVCGEKTKVEKNTYSAYCALKDDLEKQGIVIGIDSAYRSIEEQQKIMDDFIEKYGTEYAKNTVAIPGTSEHHTGLVIDIVPQIDGKWVLENEDMMKETKTFEIIHKKLSKYGFILRYLAGKEEITGYSYEPWHIRYVGRDVAEDIYNKKITLEEYLKKK